MNQEDFFVPNDEIEKYSGGNQRQKGKFFSLKNDGDTAFVRFLYDAYSEVRNVKVHDIKVGNQYRKVACLRTQYDDPITKCPLCSSSNDDLKYRSVRTYLEIEKFEVDSSGNPTGNVENMIWDRGADFHKRLKRLFEKYEYLSDYIFEVTRVGEAGNTGTFYDFDYVGEVKNGKFIKSKLPDKPFNPLNKVVLIKSAEDLTYYINNGKFPSNEEEQEETVTRRETRTEKVEEPKPTPRQEVVEERRAEQPAPKPVEEVTPPQEEGRRTRRI